MIDWDGLEKKAAPPKPVELAVPDGPEVVFPGVACRLMIRTRSDETQRDEDLTVRFYRLACILFDAGADGVVTNPQPGYRRLRTGQPDDPARYVRGGNSREVVATLGRALLSAKDEVKQQAKALGVRALMEW